MVTVAFCLLVAAADSASVVQELRSSDWYHVMAKANRATGTNALAVAVEDARRENLFWQSVRAVVASGVRDLDDLRAVADEAASAFDLYRRGYARLR